MKRLIKIDQYSIIKHQFKKLSGVFFDSQNIVFFISLIISNIVFYNLFNYYFHTKGFEFDTIVTQYTWGKNMYEMNPIFFWKSYTGDLDYQFGAVLVDYLIFHTTNFFHLGEIGFVNIIRILSLVLSYIFSYKIFRLSLTQNNVFISAIYSSIFILLPVYFFTSMIWGQIDLLILYIVGLLLYSTARFKQNRYKLLFGLCITSSLLIKQQAILIIPVCFFYLYMNGRDQNILSRIKSMKDNPYILGGFLIPTLFLFVLPLLINPLRTLFTFLQPFLRTANLSKSAYNIWSVFYNNTHNMSQVINIMGNPINVSNLIYFLLIIVFTYFVYRFRAKIITVDSFLQMSFIISFLYFFVATKMLERYAIISIFVMYILIARKNILKNLPLLISFIFFNIAYLLNLFEIYKAWNNYILDGKVLAIVYYIKNLASFVTMKNLETSTISGWFYLIGFVFALFWFWFSSHRHADFKESSIDFSGVQFNTD